MPTVCGMCYNECSIRVLVKDETAISIEGLPGAPPNYGKMCAKGKAGIADLYSPKRVTKPLKRTNKQKGLGIDPKWEEISWDEALSIITTKLKEVRKRNPLGFQIWTFDDAGYGSFSPPFEVAVGGRRGTGVPFGPSLFCGNGVHPVCLMMNGSHDHQPDLEYCRYLIQIGSGYGTGTQSHAMGLAQELANARVKRDLKMVVVDPCRNNSGLRADEWVSILPGTDSAFCLAIANVLINELRTYDQEFLLRYTNSPYLIDPDGHYSRDPINGKPLVISKSKGTIVPFDSVDSDDMILKGEMLVGNTTLKTAFFLLKEHLLKYTPEYASEITSVPTSTIRRIAKEFSEAAGLGSTTIIDDIVLPLRAACVIWYRGVSQHQHGLHNGWAAAMLNMIIGAVDVPGGNCQVCSTGPWGLPKAGEDGLLITTSPFMTWKKSVPLQPVKYEKDNADLTGMFPLATYSQTMSGLTSLDPDRFKRISQLEVFFQVRSNPMSTTADPNQIAEILKGIPFQVSFIQHHEASSQFADIILPDTHYLERFAPLITNPYRHYRHAATPSDDKWIFSTQQPVVKTAGEARHWVEVLWDLAHLADFAEDFYRTLNAWFMLTPKYRLNPKRKYTFRKFADLLMRSYCGDNRGTEYFARYGWAPARPKREVKHRYPRIFHDGRITLYLEHWITAGENVLRFSGEQKRICSFKSPTELIFSNFPEQLDGPVNKFCSIPICHTE